MQDDLMIQAQPVGSVGSSTGPSALRRFVVWLAKVLLFLLLAVVIVLLARMLGNYSRQPLYATTFGAADEATEVSQNLTAILSMPLDAQAEAEKFALGLRLPTTNSDEDPQPFLDFLQLLEATYPAAHELLERQIINDYSVIYRWPVARKNASAQPLPILSLGHIDVVPVADDELDQWAQAPFAGNIVDGVIWGRGALDFKLGIFAQLAAIEALADSGYQPQRDIWLAFGHDEESRGAAGAASIAEYFRQQQQRFAVVLDEGGLILEGFNPAVAAPIASVGIAEKDYLTIELTVQQPSGHSSVPAQETATTILSQAITRLQQQPMPPQMSYPVAAMLDTLAPEAHGLQKLALSNRWLLGGLVQQQMLATPVGAASLRTTQAVTMLSAGVRENVVSAKAQAVVNFRLLPTVRDVEVIRHVQQVINDQRVFVAARPQAARGQHRFSDPFAPAFHALSSAIKANWPEVIVTPYLALAAMDARHFEDLSEQVYRFAPIWLVDDTQGIHGINERISVADYQQAIRFYALAYGMLAELCSVDCLQAENELLDSSQVITE